MVALPVKDEADLIPACLTALASQRNIGGDRLHGPAFGVLLLLNNCADQTGAVVRGMRDKLPFPLWLVERELPPAMAHAGGARKLAMDAAADLVASSKGPGPRVVLTTDADGRVGPRWLSANLAAIADGADLVAGFIRADPREHALLPAALIRRGQLESRYEWLLTELLARLDPDEHDPWPCHRVDSGASLAITLEAYRRVGGVPAIPTGEDRALVRSLRLAGGRVRHSLAAQVLVSCRLDGRAEAGMAATITQRILLPDLACDPALEPADRLWRRGRLRAELRRRHRQGRLQPVASWAEKLKLTVVEAAKAVMPENFSATWANLEHASPVLAYRALTPRQLPEQIAAAEVMLRELRAMRLRPQAPQDVHAIVLGAGLENGLRDRIGHGDEALRRLVAAEGIIRTSGPMDENDIPARHHGVRGETAHELEIAGAPVVGHLG